MGERMDGPGFLPNCSSALPAAKTSLTRSQGRNRARGTLARTCKHGWTSARAPKSVVTRTLPDKSSFTRGSPSETQQVRTARAQIRSLRGSLISIFRPSSICFAGFWSSVEDCNLTYIRTNLDCNLRYLRKTKAAKFIGAWP